jgi:hypothetical protein
MTRISSWLLLIIFAVVAILSARPFPSTTFRTVLAHARIATSKNALSEAAPEASAQTIAA